MRIVADEDILSVDKSFSKFGELIKIPGRKIARQDLLNADALLVRSITRVDGQLLDQSGVKFVGSATAGTDHVDLDYLKCNNIEFSNASGCNANAVVEYCLTALAITGVRQSIDFSRSSFGIIGAGNVGSLLAEKLANLGYQCLVCDPFITERRRLRLEQLNCPLVGFDEALTANVISLHVPLTFTGDHPTIHLLNETNLTSLAPNAVLLNTSRGAVVDNHDLLKVLSKRNDLHAVVDVWEDEPNINRELLTRVRLGSPHIAGYSIEAKRSATARLCRNFCEFFALPVQQEGQEPSLVSEDFIELDKVATDDMDSLCLKLLSRVLPLTDITRQLRQQMSLSNNNPAQIFDKLRKQLVSRHEFCAYRVDARLFGPRQKLLLATMGFNLKQ
ncbi:MAG: 4-phosphoerythronate dehydrogenase [Gammaproteobacteria bacterium]|nr:4-phosphoerythronate dehydrogenase [Gammaproteobacteria bacterium]